MLTILKPKLAATAPFTALVEMTVAGPINEAPALPSKGRPRLSSDVFLLRLQPWRSASPASAPPNVSTPRLRGRLRRSDQGGASDAAETVRTVIMGGPLTSSKDAPTSQGDLKRLKANLAKPTQARRIVGELKRMDVPDPVEGEHAHRARGICVECEIGASSTTRDEAPTTTFGMLSKVPSAGGLLGQAMASTSAFDALASKSGQLVAASNGHLGLSPPLDRLSVLLYWWGFELAVPPPGASRPARIQHQRRA
jgi:hypothetical protein